jgi:Major intrinsic protein
MSTNPARTFGPAVFASDWQALWIYFIGPPLGMLAAAEAFLLAREREAPHCAKLHHHAASLPLGAGPDDAGKMMAACLQRIVGGNIQ